MAEDTEYAFAMPFQNSFIASLEEQALILLIFYFYFVLWVLWDFTLIPLFFSFPLFLPLSLSSKNLVQGGQVQG